MGSPSSCSTFDVMNYRHAFHAGNFADVLKHVVLMMLVEHLKKKPTPFFYLDTHAGRGVYDLSEAQAQRSGEYKTASVGVLEARTATCRRGGGLRQAGAGVRRQGSQRHHAVPRLAADRGADAPPADRLVLMETLPKEADALGRPSAASGSCRCSRATATRLSRHICRRARTAAWC